MGKCLKCGFEGIRIVCECGHSQIVSKVDDFKEPFWHCGVCNTCYPVDPKFIAKIRRLKK